MIVASIPKRGVAFIIDEVVVSFYFMAIFWDEISAIKSADAFEMFAADNLIVLFGLKVAYHTFFIGLNGMTLGKYLVKIKAVDLETKQSIGFIRAFIRAVFRFANELFFYIGFWFALFAPLKQTLHDYSTNTVVIDV